MKGIKRLGTAFLLIALCIGSTQSAFAATKSESRAELKQYNAGIATKRTRLSELNTQIKSIKEQISAAQQTAKENGLIDKAARTELKALSTPVKETRQEIKSIQTERKELRAEAKAARRSGDYITAKEKLITLSSRIDDQTALKSELIVHLNKKLDYLNALISNPSADNESTQPQTDEQELNEALDDGAELDEDESTEDELF